MSRWTEEFLEAKRNRVHAGPFEQRAGAIRDEIAALGETVGMRPAQTFSGSNKVAEVGGIVGYQGTTIALEKSINNVREAFGDVDAATSEKLEAAFTKWRTLNRDYHHFKATEKAGYRGCP